MAEPARRKEIMFKRIDTADVVPGMFIHKLEGNWFWHPFWRSRFLLTDPDMLDRLHGSAVPAVIIDTSRGLDCATSPPPAPTAAAATAQAGAATVRRRLPVAASAVPPLAHAPPAPPAFAPRVLTMPPTRVVRSFGRAGAIADCSLNAVTEAFLEVRLGKALEPARVAPVVDSVIRSIQTNPYAMNGLMQLRTNTSDVYQHALATSALMVGLGRTLQLDPINLHAAGLAGLLLDIGVTLLLADEPATSGGQATIPADMLLHHVEPGRQFVERCGLAENIMTACSEHHERIDGGGWPNGASGLRISKLGRMAAICDHFDLAVSDGFGTGKIDPGEALRRMKADHGAFDTEMLDAFQNSIGLWPIGSVVELRSGRIGVVIDQNGEAINKPLLAVFFNPADGRRIDNLWIDLNCCYGADAIVGTASIDDLPDDLQPVARSALMATINRVTGGGRISAKQGAAA